MISEANVILLTGHFPYYPGEQFLEEEINCWGRYFKGKITIIPSNSRGACRAIPHNVRLRRLDKNVGKGTKLFLGAKTLFSMLLLKEVFFLFFSKKAIRYSLLKSALLMSYRVLFTAYCYEKVINAELRSRIVIYSYWNNVESYAMAYLRQRRKEYNFTLISRAHGFDVYEELKHGQYMPLKRQFKNKFDNVLAISEMGGAYLQTRYHFKNVMVMRLGVTSRSIPCKPSEGNQVVVLSLSHCTPVKRIDRIIKGIYTFASANPGVDIRWHHIGDGDTLCQLKKLADRLLNLQNVAFVFRGGLTNTEVHHFIQRTNIDVILNTSESEGVPVSIMEAMSYGIPAIAPNIGGVRELVLPENGILMSQCPNEYEIAASLERNEFYKNNVVRQAAQKHITENFDSEKNYKNLINMVNNYMHSMQ